MVKSKSKLIVVGVAGGTGAGKSTIVEEILKKLGTETVSVIQHDSYYKNRPELSLDERSKINFDHPNIKSFAMSMSKYNFSWNRIGLRWSRQRSMDSCTLISAQRKYNELTTACGSFMMDHIPRDYGWSTYGELNKAICDKLDLTPTMYFYVVKDKNDKLYSIGKLLGQVKQ